MQCGNMKRTALVIQLVGLAAITLGACGVFILRESPLYLPMLVGCIIILGFCLVHGDAMRKKAQTVAKQPED
jgi:hypothetical protein